MFNELIRPWIDGDSPFRINICFCSFLQLPRSTDGVEFRTNAFWMQKYCPSHEQDGTPECCSCTKLEVLSDSLAYNTKHLASTHSDRCYFLLIVYYSKSDENALYLQPRDMPYMALDDDRKLCLQCLNSAVTDYQESQPLYCNVDEFFRGLDMEVHQQIPFHLVERTALNKAMEGEKNVIPPSHCTVFTFLFRLNFPPPFLPQCSITMSRDIITFPRREGFACRKIKLFQRCEILTSEI